MKQVILMNTLLKNFLKHSSTEYRQMKLGLGRVQEALEQFRHPEREYASILIAGTNGKGSVARIVESVLRCAGHRVGLYTSPHLESFFERIRIGGEEVKEEEVVEVLEDWKSLRFLSEDGRLCTSSEVTLTWFEHVTVLAFEIFKRKEVSLAILEVGLGGRLDATNVVDPLVSAITSVSLDHTEVLGNSVFEIAREKAEVMRAGRPMVLGFMSEELRTFLMKATRMRGAQPLMPSLPQGTTENFSCRNHQNLGLGLKGEHQLKNAAVAIEILGQLKEHGFPFSEGELREGLARVSNPGRMEYLKSKPPLILDGAHNIEALEALAAYLKKNFLEKPLTIVLGMMKDKDFAGALKILAPLRPRFIFTQLDSERSLKISDWKEICEGQGILGEFQSDPLEALRIAQEQTPKEGVIVVTGSLYLVGALRGSVSAPLV
jgi:dihydrofolate synthase / folylpolyglutamate synthase